MMKRIPLILLALCLAGSLFSCRDQEPSPAECTTGTSEGTKAPEPAAPVSKEETMVKEALQLKHTLRFNGDGKFKILVFSDVHAAENLSPDTVLAIEAVVKKEAPDLVLFNGDLNFCLSNIEEIRNNIIRMTAYLEEHEIPWAHVYGNHDSEMAAYYPAVSREEQQKIYESLTWCLSKSGDPALSGVGNYVLPILRSDSDRIAFNVWGLDSGSYLDVHRPGLEKEVIGSLSEFSYSGKNYAYIPFNQIAWYYETSEALEAYNGTAIPAMMMFHIPLVEYFAVARNAEQTGMEGLKQENINSAELNSGLFAAALERGDIRMFVAGHDHVNDFVGTYCGIRLAYDANIGFQTYCDPSIMGARVIEIDQNDAANFTTRMSCLVDIPGWDSRSDIDAKTTETVGSAPFAGDVLTAEDATEMMKSGTDLLTAHDTAALTGQYYSGGMKAAGGDGATVTVAAEKGFGGSNAYAVAAMAGERAKSELTLYLPEARALGDARYLRVYADFTSTDFSAASFGLVSADGVLYTTDMQDNAAYYLDYYYLPDGETEWQHGTHSLKTGCFGKEESEGVLNFRGWLAFPISDFRAWEGKDGEFASAEGTAPDSATKIAGVYLTYNLLRDYMTRKPFYLDEFGLVPAYNVFETAT